MSYPPPDYYDSPEHRRAIRFDKFLCLAIIAAVFLVAYGAPSC